MRVIDATATREALPFGPLVDALRRMFAEGCEVPLRHTHRIEVPGHRTGTMLLMPAWRPGRHLGLKLVSIFPDNASRGQPGLHSVYLLFDATTGEPLAQIDGNEITSRRTAAASALAASFLARDDAHVLLVVGAGRVASVMAQAMRTVRPIDRVLTWSRRADAATRLAARLRDDGFDAEACQHLEAAVPQADIVSCATLATLPLVNGRWLRPGVHLDLVGSFSPEMIEGDAQCFARARVFVDTPEAMAKSGDVLNAMSEGAFVASQLQGTLTQLCRGEATGRRDPMEITLFKSVGTALEDLAAAEMVHERFA
jgi:ornithine cyclodeaminase/alanine dehydrogenase-like protein (mu-crystallin family)